MQLKSRIALVTGSTSGIGLGIAEAFAREGADVMLNGLGAPAEIEAALARVRAHGTRVLYDDANMLDGARIAGMVARCEQDLGRLDILVNNAGIQHVSPIESFPVEKWDQIIAINLSSAFHAVRAAVPGMKARRSGRIINIASAHSLTASPFKSAYVAAKHGIAGLTKAVALELAEQGVTCNAISPGFVWTPLVERQIPDLARSEGISEADARKKVLSRQPTRQFVTIEQVAALAVFLASDAAAPITGSNYSIDGGWTAE